MSDETPSVGRPAIFTQVLADQICERIADGDSLRTICDGTDFPNRSTVFKWLSLYPEFSDQYARAREAQADAIFDDMLSIADTPVIGEKTKTTSDGKNETTSGDMIEHRRLQVETRKWMAGKLRPKKYSDKLDLNVSGSLQTMPEDQLNARLNELLGKAGVAVSASGTGTPEEDEQA